MSCKKRGITEEELLSEKQQQVPQIYSSFFFLMCGLIKIGRIHKIDSDGVCVHTPVPRKVYLIIHMMHISDAKVLVRVLV